MPYTQAEGVANLNLVPETGSGMRSKAFASASSRLATKRSCTPCAQSVLFRSG